MVDHLTLLGTSAYEAFTCIGRDIFIQPPDVTELSVTGDLDHLVISYQQLADFYRLQLTSFGQIPRIAREL